VSTLTLGAHASPPDDRFADAYLLRLQQESTAITQRLGLWTILQAGSVMLILLGAAALTLITAG